MFDNQNLVIAIGVYIFLFFALPLLRGFILADVSENRTGQRPLIFFKFALWRLMYGVYSETSDHTFYLATYFTPVKRIVVKGDIVNDSYPVFNELHIGEQIFRAGQILKFGRLLQILARLFDRNHARWQRRRPVQSG